MLANRQFDVSDGEDLEWAFISRGGKVLETERRDRLAPDAPLLDAPPEGSWTRGPLRVSILPDESGTTAFLSARLRYATGETEVLRGTSFLYIRSARELLAEVTVEGFLMDESGNQGPKTIRNFILDPKTIYVSDLPLYSGNANAVRGGIDNPFTSLEEAINYVQNNNLEHIRIAGTQILKRSVSVSRNIVIDGGWRDGNSGVIIMENGFSWLINPGINVSFRGLRMERRYGSSPLIQAGKNAALEIKDSMFINTGPLLHLDEGICKLSDTRMQTTVSGEERIAAISARNSVMEISRSRIQLNASYSLLFKFAGGTISAGDSVFLAAGRRTASIFTLNGTRGNFSGLTITAAARDYASLLETSGSDFVLSGGILGTSARDTTAILLNDSSALIHDAQIRVEASFSAKAIDIRGRLPVVRDSLFIFEGEASRSEVFSVTGVSMSQDFAAAGNRYVGFTKILNGNSP
jgi:hypothetical protein